MSGTDSPGGGPSLPAVEPRVRAATSSDVSRRRGESGAGALRLPSFAPNPDWERTFSSGKQIWEYEERVARGSVVRAARSLSQSSRRPTMIVTTGPMVEMS